MRVIFATGNKNKLAEIREIFKDTELEVVSMKEAGFDEDIEETGETFEENSYIKAKTIWDKFGGYVMADDSGFMVDYLNGAPGVYSARYLGEDASYEDKCNGILTELKGVTNEKRGARFATVITTILPDGSKVVTTGTIEGIVYDHMQGENGFGYDPILYIPELKKTMAELTMDEKNKISHRGKALRLMREKLISMF